MSRPSSLDSLTGLSPTHPLGNRPEHWRLACALSDIRLRKRGDMLGSILLFMGIALSVYGFGGGSIEIGIGGVVLLVVGVILFWRTSATRAYLNHNKRR